MYEVHNKYGKLCSCIISYKSSIMFVFQGYSPYMYAALKFNLQNQVFIKCSGEQQRCQTSSQSRSPTCELICSLKLNSVFRLCLWQGGDKMTEKQSACVCVGEEAPACLRVCMCVSVKEEGDSVW